MVNAWTAPDTLKPATRPMHSPKSAASMSSPSCNQRRRKKSEHGKSAAVATSVYSDPAWS
jgi:hypothetical protein